MSLNQYLAAINRRFKAGNATEHTYRGDLQILLEDLLDDVEVTNEPKRVSCGAPDFIVSKTGIPIGYVEAKDVGKRLDDKAFEEQLLRYRSSLPNLVVTNYLDFEFFRGGISVHHISVGELTTNAIKPNKNNFDDFTALIRDFGQFQGLTIDSASDLALKMANKARLMANIMGNAVQDDLENEQDSELAQQYWAFRSVLIHDIEPQQFADIYSQTIAYGLFAARLHDESPSDFSRQEAAELIPKSNPFLRRLFHSIAGPDLDKRIDWVVDSLTEVFRAADMPALMLAFGDSARRSDPFLHFYETFLAEYDPSLRRSRGVWYTPEPIVRFMVRAVDYLIKKRFHLSEGLANTSKTTIKVQTDKPDRRTKSGYTEIDKEVHRVQILDPAVGTGTFLAEILNEVFTQFADKHGIWSNYVKHDLIPRIHGFEILMASYAVAHLKLEMLLEETGVELEEEQRLGVYLTNSLEKFHPDTGTLFSAWLSNEAREANLVKRDAPVMVVIANPPYSIMSSNLSPEQMEVIDRYKYVDGTRIEERGALQLQKNLNDDYVKFIALAEDFVTKNGTGIVAYINNHSLLDARTLRGLRWHLLKTFDEIYVIDLHGSSKKREIPPEGTTDENVFDIQQGVSIQFLIRIPTKRKLAQVFHTELWGTREQKYEKLIDWRFQDVKFEEIFPKEPHYYFVPYDDATEDEYSKGFSLDELFTLHSSGIITARDKLTIGLSREQIWKRVTDFSERTPEELRERYSLGKDSTTWKVKLACKDIKGTGPNSGLLTEIAYRPFDTRFTYYTGKVTGFYTNPRKPVMQHLLAPGNLALVCCKQLSSRDFNHVFVSERLVESCLISNRTREVAHCFPLYVLPANDSTTLQYECDRVPNLEAEIVDIFAAKIDLEYSPTGDETGEKLTPQELFDYIYAVLHSPVYRELYAPFLRRDFPRIPYPKNVRQYREKVRIGRELRRCHLLRDPGILQRPIKYPISGDNTVSKSISEKDFESTDDDFGRIWINDEQYFEGVPKSVWLAEIGAYRPAQKWLKDRKGTELKFDDIRHFEKIIAALAKSESLKLELRSIDQEYLASEG